MKRIISQTGAIALFLLAVTIGLKAQSDTQYRAQIPFDFEAAGKHYAAGSYSVGLALGAVTIRDRQNGHMNVLGMNPQVGSDNWDIPGTLTFRKVDGLYTLSQIVTPTFKKEMRISKTKGELAKAAASTPVTIALK